MEKKTILCVDDEKVILSVVKSQLRSALGNSFNIEAAESPSEGLEIVEDYSRKGRVIQIIVSDWLMPEMKGDEFLKEVHDRHPGIVKIILSGEIDSETTSEAVKNANLYKCLKKPWKMEELVDVVNNGLACA